MAKAMKLAAASSFLLTMVFIGLHFSNVTWAFPCAITFGTCFYHFFMRLVVGYSINCKMRNRADYTKPWYQPRSFEASLYRILQVKKWKAGMPTYNPSLFDPKQHSWDEIAQAMCQAEIVHEVIAILSFLPLLGAIPFGAFPVFLITAVLSALFDLSFVATQRFNRPRILKLINKERTVK